MSADVLTSDQYPPCTCSHINEDKRKTEGQMQMFEVLRDVEGCPVRSCCTVVCKLVEIVPTNICSCSSK